MLFLAGFRFFTLFLNLVYSSSLLGAGSNLAGGQYIKYQAPEFLTFEELVELSKNPKPGGLLGAKLEQFWKTPIISNEAWFRGARPRKLTHPTLGEIMSVASWNIEKSFNIPDVITLFTDPAAFAKMVDEDDISPKSESYKNMVRQRLRLIQSDILILQEIDIGHNRSGYLDAAAEMAKALDMNYAYGAEQLEIDPVYLGTETVMEEDGSSDESATAEFKADPARYKGVFGQAVLSRYPIKNVEVFQLKTQPYDWYEGEKAKTAFMENTRRLGTKLLFKHEITRELKVGGRIYFRVDLDVPELPGNTLTIINIHLEIKCQPKGREDQMREILSYIGDIKNPVIMMGDFNAAPNDISPTSTKRIVSRTAKNPNTWVNAAITLMTPYGPVNMARNVSNMTKNVQDPFVANIDVIAPNPLKPMFEMIENFRFADGGAFDFRGDAIRSANGKKKKMANSNQRDFKGFKTTFQVRRPLGPIIGKLRLDWVFVKSFLKDPGDKEGPYQFAPHFGETLEELNTGMMEAFSDHHPNVIDLPFKEPRVDLLEEAA